VVLVAFVVLGVIALYLFRKNQVQAYLFRLLAHFLQTAAFLILLRVSWPGYFDSLLEYMSLSGIDGGIVSMRCYFPEWNIFSRFAASLIVPAFLLLILFVTYHVLDRRASHYDRVHRRRSGVQAFEAARAQNAAEDSKKKVRRAAVLVVSLSYVAQVKYALAMFTCSAGYLTADPLVSCQDNPSLVGVRVLAGIVLACVGVGFPLVIFYRLRTSSRLLDEKSFLYFVTEPYVQRMPWFEGIIMSRKLVCLIALQLSSDSYLQSGVCLAASLVYAVFVWYRKPYHEYNVQRSALLRALVCCCRDAEVPQGQKKRQGTIDLPNAAERLAASVLVIVYLLSLFVSRDGETSRLVSGVIAALVAVVVFCSIMPIWVSFKLLADESAMRKDESVPSMPALGELDLPRVSTVIEMKSTAQPEIDPAADPAVEKMWNKYVAVREKMAHQEETEDYGGLERSAAEARKLRHSLNESLDRSYDHAREQRRLSRLGVLDERLMRLREDEAEENKAMTEASQPFEAVRRQFEFQLNGLLNQLKSDEQTDWCKWLVTAEELIAFGHGSDAEFARLQRHLGRVSPQEAREVRVFRQKKLCSNLAPSPKGMSAQQAAVALLEKNGCLTEFDNRWKELVDTLRKDSECLPVLTKERNFLEACSRHVATAQDIQSTLSTEIDIVVGGWFRSSALRHQPESAAPYDVLREVLKILQSKPPFNATNSAVAAAEEKDGHFEETFGRHDQQIAQLIDAHQIKEAQKVDAELRHFLTETFTKLRQAELGFLQQYDMLRLAATLETHQAQHLLANKYCQ